MKKALELVNELKDKKIIEDYAIGGGKATIYYTEPFLTKDLDFFVFVKDSKSISALQPVYDFFKEKGYSWEGQWIIIDGEKVEFFIAGKPLQKEALENAREVAIEGVKTKILSPEYLMAIALDANRTRDKLKVEMMIQQEVEIDQDRLYAVLDKYNLRRRYEGIVRSLKLESFRTPEQYRSKLEWRKEQARKPFEDKLKDLEDLKDIEREMRKIRPR